MINFNVPPYCGKEKEYVGQAIDNHKICGDGEFTKKCSKWIEERTGTDAGRMGESLCEMDRGLPAVV